MHFVLIAIAPWNWGGCGGPCVPPMDEIGTQEMPLARAAWQKIGLATQKNTTENV